MAKVAESILFNVILAASGVILAAAAFFLLFFFLCIWRVGKQIAEAGRKKDGAGCKRLKRAKKKLGSYVQISVAVCLFCVWLLIFGCWVKQEYSMKDRVQAERLPKISEAEFFKERERTLPKVLSQCEEALHMDWYTEQELSSADGVTEKAIDNYVLNVRILFQNNQKKKSLVSPVIPEQMQESYEVYSAAVRLGNSNSIQELVQGYRKGEEIIPYYNTSETVFQAMVLAESANIAQFRVLSELLSDELDSLRAFTVLLEGFLAFETLDAGDGVIIERQQAAFRMGKMMYRQVLYQSSLPEDMKLHCTLFAYGCFAYSREEEVLESESYLLYLYYHSLSCLELLKDVKDAELGKSLCQEELLLWGGLEAVYPQDQWTRYFLDGESMSNILFAQTQLKAMERQFANMCSG